MRWLWTFGKVPELEPEGVLAVSKHVMGLSESERSAPSAPRIIDVRTQGEYAAGHVAGAVNASFLPPWAWPSNVAPLLSTVEPATTELYVICLSAHRSIGALKWLQDHGYKNVKQLKGGMQAWRALSLPEVRPGSGQGDATGQQDCCDASGQAGSNAAGKPCCTATAASGAPGMACRGAPAKACCSSSCGGPPQQPQPEQQGPRRPCCSGGGCKAGTGGQAAQGQVEQQPVSGCCRKTPVSEGPSGVGQCGMGR